jgi:hypothetical protein
MNETTLMMAMKRQFHALGQEAERLARLNIAMRVAMDDTVSLACAFAWDLGAGNRLEMTPEEFDECIEIRFGPEIDQLKKDVKLNPILVTP